MRTARLGSLLWALMLANVVFTACAARDDPAAILQEAVELATLGRYAEAEPLYKRALEIDENALGLDHPDVAFSRGTYSLTATPEGAPEPVSDRGKWVAIWGRQPDGTWLRTAVIWNSDLPLPELGVAVVQPAFRVEMSYPR